jgi:hypothetical protein
MSLFGKPNKNPTGPGTAIGQIIGAKTPDQIADEAKAAAERLETDAKYNENPNGMEMKTFKATTIPAFDPEHPERVHVGGRRRKSRRGKSRKYKRTLKRRKNKTKNRK